MRLLQSNVFWSGFEAATSATLSFASAFIVARIVGPAEVGVGAAVVALHVLLWVVVNALFADAIVQRPAVSDEDASSAFWVAVMVGALGAAVQAGAAWPLSHAMDDNRIVAMSLALALPLPVVGAGGAVQGLLTRNRQYKVLAGRALIGQGLGTLAGIGMAFAGAGAWALVGQQLVTSLLGAVSLLLRSPWRPSLRLHWRPVRELLGVGLPLVLSTLVLHGRYRVFALIVGSTAGAVSLGQVHMAFRLVDTVRDLIATAMWRLFLPTLAERQSDLPALHAAMNRFLRLSSVVLFPALGGMLVTIEPLVRLLLGPVWMPSAQASSVLVLLSVYIFLVFPPGVALVARGITRPTLIASTITTLLTLGGVAVFRPATPLHAVEVWLAAQVLVQPGMQMFTARVLGTTVLGQVRAGLPALALAMFATAAALLIPRLLGEPQNPALLIVNRLGIGALVYLPGALFLLPGSVFAVLRSVGLRRHPA